MSRSEQDEMAVGGVIKIFPKSIQETFSVHNNEDTYGFKDEMAERTVNRTVKLDLSINPFRSLQETFNFFDGDNSGHISKQEFREAMIRLVDDLSSEEIEDMMDEMDLDGDGMISFREFSRAMAHIHFDEDDHKSHRDMTNQPNLSWKEKNLIASEVVVPSRALTLQAIEPALCERDEGQMINVEYSNIKSNLNNDHNIAAFEGEESHEFKDKSLEPGTTMRSVICREAFSSEGRSIKNFIDSGEKMQLMLIKRSQKQTVNTVGDAHTGSSTITLDNLDQRSESLEAESELSKDCDILSKPKSEPGCFTQAD